MYAERGKSKLKSEILQSITNAESKAQLMFEEAKLDAQRQTKENADLIEKEKEHFISSNNRSNKRALDNLEKASEKTYMDKMKYFDEEARLMRERAEDHLDECCMIIVESVLDV